MPGCESQIQMLEIDEASYHDSSGDEADGGKDDLDHNQYLSQFPYSAAAAAAGARAKHFGSLDTQCESRWSHHREQQRDYRNNERRKEHLLVHTDFIYAWNCARR